MSGVFFKSLNEDSCEFYFGEEKKGAVKKTTDSKFSVVFFVEPCEEIQSLACDNYCSLGSAVQGVINTYYKHLDDVKRDWKAAFRKYNKYHVFTCKDIEYFLEREVDLSTKQLVWAKQYFPFASVSKTFHKIMEEVKGRHGESLSEAFVLSLSKTGSTLERIFVGQWMAEVL